MKTIQRHIAALLVLGILALWTIYPVLPDFTSRIIGWSGGDNMQYVYITGWAGQAVFKGLSPFFDPQLNYPDGLWLTATDAPFLTMVLLSPVTLLLNPVASYNSIILLSTFLSGLFTYLWLYRLTGSRLAGLAAGVVFLLSPFRLVHSYGHLQMVSTQFIPLYFWALDLALSDERPKARRLALVGAAVFFLATTTQYYTLISLVGSIGYVLAARPQIDYLLRHSWKLGLTVGLSALLGSLPYLWTILSTGIYEKYPFAETMRWSASLADFIIPSRLHALWGEWIPSLYPRQTWVEHTLYLGIGALILAICGLRWNTHLDRRLVGWLGAAGLGFLLALGSDLRVWNGLPLEPSIPLFAGLLNQISVVNLVHVWSRYAILPIFFTAALAGIGFAALMSRLRWPPIARLAFGLSCLTLLIVDMAPGHIETSLVEILPVQRWLADQQGQFAVAILPPGEEQYYHMYGSLFHDKSMSAVNHPQHMPQAYQDFLAAVRLLRRGNSTGIANLESMGYSYLIVSSQAYNESAVLPDWETFEQTLLASKNLTYITTVETYRIYAIKQP